MKIGIMGFGRAGRAVSSVVLESKKTTLQWVLRRSNVLEHRSVPEFLGVPSDEPGLIYSIAEFGAADLLEKFPVDVIVDFSSDDGIQYYGEEAAQRGITIISAVSQYSEGTKAFLYRLAERTQIIYSPNITLGINFLLIAAKVLKNIAPYTDIEIIEEHFKKKAETSGTAKVLCKALELPESSIKSIRAGGIIGVHEIVFGFPFQTVRLKHESISREAFGNGIMFALENLPQQRSGLFTMEDLMLPYFAMTIDQEKLTINKKKPWWKFW